jgi:CheY-like chemotaxis protein
LAISLHAEQKVEGLKNNNYIVRIPVIEDDGEMRSLLKDFLEEEGFETESVSNGSDGLHKTWPTKKPK